MTPEDFKSNYRSIHGAGFRCTCFLNHLVSLSQPRSHIPNLYFSTAGAPRCRIPGRVMLRQVVENLITEEK